VPGRVLDGSTAVRHEVPMPSLRTAFPSDIDGVAYKVDDRTVRQFGSG
jgi:hypothetical protein